MTPRTLIGRLTANERLNFLLTNRIPRRWATLFMGWFSQREHPWVRQISIAVWQLFAGDLRLYEAKKKRFTSMQDCFIRELKPGARPLHDDSEILVSPCDGVVGAHGLINGRQVFQAKGFPYALIDLLADPALAERYKDGVFITLRLKANMYHRFHAPQAGQVRQVRYISGDTWNVNPVALKRVERLYCKNERAVLELKLKDSEHSVTLVAVAAILVASIKVHGLQEPLNLRYQGANVLSCNQHFERGDEMGYFRQGSTLVVFAPAGFRLADNIGPGVTLRMGQPLLVKPS